MSGFLSLLFLGVGLAVAFPLALHYWPREDKRKLAIIWTITSTVCATIGLIAGWVYYFYPPPAVIQTTTISPPAKPYVFVKEARMEPLIAGKGPVALLEVQNGPTDTTFSFKNASFFFTRSVPEKYLHYKKSSSPSKNKAAPHQVIVARWTPYDLVLSQDQIEELNADKPTAELYVFAQGEWTDGTETHPLDICWQYDRDFPAHLIFCRDNIKIE